MSNIGDGCRIIPTGVFPDNFKTTKVVSFSNIITVGQFRNQIYQARCQRSETSGSCKNCCKTLFEHTLSQHLFGFRKEISWSVALRSINKYILEHLNKNKRALIVFLGIGKAFDTIDVRRLIDKLDHIGIRATAFAQAKKLPVKPEEIRNAVGSPFYRRGLAPGLGLTGLGPC